MRKVLTAEALQFFPFAVMTVVYAPRGIETNAMQVTRENIGAIGMELDCEVFYYGNKAWIPLLVERENDHGKKHIVNMDFHPGDWMVALRGELHLFKDDVFCSTFGRVGEKAHEAGRTEYQPDAPAEPVKTYTIPLEALTARENAGLPPLPLVSSDDTVI